MIRIGTRKSALALWQANQVKNQLDEFGAYNSFSPVESEGDQNLDRSTLPNGNSRDFHQNT